DIASKRRRAGQARAANARRDERGRLLPSSKPSTTPAHAGVLDQRDASTATAQSSSPDPVPDPVLPEQGEPVDLRPPGRERSPRALPDVSPAQAPAPAPVQVQSTSWQRGNGWW